MVARGVGRRLSLQDYDGVKLEFATTVGEYRHGCGDKLDLYGAEIKGDGCGIEVHLNLDNGNWKGHVTDNRTCEVIGYNTPDLKSILEDITNIQSNGVQRVSQTQQDIRRFNTPELFDAIIEGVQQDAQPNWDFANEDGMEK